MALEKKTGAAAIVAVATVLAHCLKRRPPKERQLCDHPELRDSLNAPSKPGGEGNQPIFKWFVASGRQFL